MDNRRYVKTKRRQNWCEYVTSDGCECDPEQWLLKMDGLNIKATNGETLFTNASLELVGRTRIHSAPPHLSPTSR